MLSLCQVCLATDRTLQALKEPLSNWHDELCDFGIEDYALYCTECAYVLNKFHNFKEKCQQANRILKRWKKLNPKARPQLNQLKNEMPPSVLGYSNINNHKVFFYQEPVDKNESILNSHLMCQNNTLTGYSGFVVDTLFPTSTSNQDITFNIHKLTSNNESLISKDVSTCNVKLLKDISSELDPDNTNINTTCELKTILIEPCNEDDFLKESEVKTEEEPPNDTETIMINELHVKNDIDSDFNNDSDHNIATDDSDNCEFDVEKLLTKSLNSDVSSDEETVRKKRKKSIKTDSDIKEVKEDLDCDIPLNKLKTVKRLKKDLDGHKNKSRTTIRAPIKKLNLDAIKYNLLCKFGNKEVKDEEGNIIDKDCIIESLDKMHKYTLNKVKRHCLGLKPFSPEAIQVLSQIQKRYGNQFSSIFTTVHLTTTEQVLEEFYKRQHHESYVTSEHKCTLCYRGFKHKKLLDYHTSEYHNPERAHVCNICQMRFKSASGLCKHNGAHRAAYKCKLCPLVTNYRTVMENHYNQHNGVKYSCEICKAELNSKPCLNAHMNYVHPSRWICALCARTFVSECGLTQHRIRKHVKEELTPGPAAARCDACDVTFVSAAVYQTHLGISHADKSTAENYAHTYKKRKMTAKRQPPNFVCRVCKKVEHSIGRMTWHFKTEHPEENTDSMSMFAQSYKHLCHVCGKGYASVTDFNEHKHLHTGAKPYACDKCPKTFHRKTNLRSHLERHLPPTRECPHCGKKFLSAANLNNHIKMHIGIRKYACELCAKSFLHRSALNAHVRGVHQRIRRTRKPNKEGE